MIEIWGGKSTAKEIVAAITKDMYLGDLDCEALCARYDLELAAYPHSNVVKRGNSRKIYRPSRANLDKIQLLEVIVDSYMLKLFDPNYVALSLQTALLENGAKVPYHLGRERSIKLSE
jgi:hypothetical protein